MTQAIRRALLASLSMPVATAPLRRLMHGRATIFMLHRFRDDERGVAGHDPAELRRMLARLRRDRYDLLPLGELVARLRGDGPPPARAVAFTIDDGYLDHATVAAPVFAEFDCPVTTFVTTGFLDGHLWMWWDRVSHCFTRASAPSLAVALGGEELAYPTSSLAARAVAAADFTARCKEVPNAEREAAIERLAVAAEVELPASPPTGCEPMSWAQLRACERAGMSFGPHTVTHPVLSRTGDAESRAEIAESWRRLREESGAPVPVFCYPNGRLSDFGAREVSTLEQLGLTGAVVGESGYARVDVVSGNPRAAYFVPRFSYPDDLPYTLQYASGLERVKQSLRGEA